jgi:hypothetical protein
MSFFKSKELASTPFANFIRNASSEEKKKVYSKVLRRASESQNEVIERAKKRARSR